MSDIRIDHRPAADIDDTYIGRTLMIGCYAPTELLKVEQLRIERLTVLLTYPEGMLIVPGIAPVTIMDAL